MRHRMSNISVRINSTSVIPFPQQVDRKWQRGKIHIICQSRRNKIQRNLQEPQFIQSRSIEGFLLQCRLNLHQPFLFGKGHDIEKLAFDMQFYTWHEALVESAKDDDCGTPGTDPQH